jgi:Fur family transcriptional regulator, ferric uptake regulator
VSTVVSQDPGTTDVHEVAARRLREQNQRYTRGRHQIVESLVALRQPVTIPELLAHDASVAQSSAYRNLAVLEEAEVVRRVQSADEFVRWELSEDLTEHHHHLICTVCGSVVDVTIPPALERSIDQVVARIEADTGFRTDSHRVDLLGRCAACG